MLKKKFEDICNRQVEREGYSSNLYLAMASWAETNGLSGVAGWLYTQAVEEESSVQVIIDKLRLGGKNSLYQFDRDIMDLRTPAGEGQTT